MTIWPSLTRIAMLQQYQSWHFQGYRGEPSLLKLSDDDINKIVQNADKYEEEDPDLLEKARKAVQQADSIIKPLEGDPYIWKNGTSGCVKKYTNSNELKVCKILKQADQKCLKNVVSVYDVRDEYVLEEKLIPCKPEDFKQNWEQIKLCIQAGLQQLHANCVIHMDLKTENIGFVLHNGEKVFKLFDFNVSGISTPDYKSWNMDPLNTYKKQFIEGKVPQVFEDKRIYDTYCLDNFHNLHSPDFWYE